MRCPHCGQDNLDSARACTRCGGALALPKAPWETDPRVRAVPRAAPAPRVRPSAPAPVPAQTRRPPASAPPSAPPPRQVSWADATDTGGMTGPPAQKTAPATLPRASAPAGVQRLGPPPPAGPPRREDPLVERVRTENRSPQPAWDEIIARAPTDALKRLKTNRAAEAETQVNMRSPLSAAAPVLSSEDRTLLDHRGGPSQGKPLPVAIPTDAENAAPSFLDITERQPPPVQKPKAPTVLNRAPRGASDTLPPFEAPTLKPDRLSKGPQPVRTPPLENRASPPATRAEVPRDATLKGVVMAEARDPTRDGRVLENPRVQLRSPPGLADDLDLPPTRPVDHSASDVAQATHYGVLAPEPSSPSLGGATRVAAKDALAGGSPSRGQVPAFGQEAERRREARAEDPMPWDVNDPELTPELAFEPRGRGAPSAEVSQTGLGIGELSLPGEPALGAELSGIEMPQSQAGDVRVQTSGLGRRGLAISIDAALALAMVAGPAGLGLFGSRLASRGLWTLDGFTGAIRNGELLLPLGVFVSLLFIGSLVLRLSVGRTPGEWMMRISLVRSKDAQKPGTARIVLRSLFGLFSLGLAGAGYFFCILDRRSRTLHDVLSGVTMIKGQPVRTGPEG